MTAQKIVKGYWSTKQLCKRFCCSSRTLDRWRKREENPFPEPKLAAIGSQNRWAIDDIVKWENTQSPNNEEQEQELDGASAA